MCAPISTVGIAQVLGMCQLLNSSDGNGVTPSCQQAKIAFWSGCCCMWKGHPAYKELEVSWLLNCHA